MAGDKKAALPHTKATREDWLAAARATLISSGVEKVKIAALSTQLGVARSSFYWYFANRQELLDALLEFWRNKNTAPIVERAERSAPTITQAVLNVFECWSDVNLFDPKLDFAIREWARRDPVVRELLDEADSARLEALVEMHHRFGQSNPDALVLARVHYHSQIGLYALGAEPSMKTRRERLPAYLRAFTGEDPTSQELSDFQAWIENVPTAL